jgi:hypothetical protein
MSAAMPSRRPTSTPGCELLKRASSSGTSTLPAGSSAPIQIRPRGHPAQFVDIGVRAVQLGEDAAGPSGDGLPRLGDDDAPAGALEQRRAELSFELPDLVGQGRLGDVELFGGAGEVAVPRDGFHAAQLLEVHAVILYCDQFHQNYACF